ncbi:borealin [Harpegnathos saltator]|uniref:Borealin n=1 Tax=Harpegnathos saltator TaxID=610380 RepID=E2BDM0_HARSA|nr:borealin [Harpegnathos saltator]EFN86182.1 Borealin [Harpegnathos saltator]
MPRTKYTRKPKAANDSLDECDIKLKTFDRHVQNSILKLQQDAEVDIRTFKTFVDVMISRLPLEIRQMTLKEIFALESNSQENYNEITLSEMQLPTGMAPGTENVTKTGVKRATAISDDGYATEGGTSVGSTSRVTKVQAPGSAMKRMRSSTRINKLKTIETIQKTVKKTRAKSKDLSVSTAKTDVFKTPAIPKSSANTYDLVTPKIKPNTPLNVLRRPRQGEMVLSMQGSPLLVSAVIEEKTANVNVPLSDGNMMSLLPQEGLRISHIPPLDDETMHQLETLKKHIEKVIALK